MDRPSKKARKGEQSNHHYIFTWNNPPDEWKQYFMEWPNLGADPVSPLPGVHPGYVAIGCEVAPDTGTPHLQGFVSFACKTKVSTLKNIWRLKYPERNAAIQGIHWEVALHYKCWKDARLYGIKEGNDNLEFGVGTLNKVGRGKRTDLDTVREAIKSGEIRTISQLQMFVGCETYSSYLFGKELCRGVKPVYNFVPIVCWVSGPTGVGKSREVRSLIERMEANRGWSSWISFDVTLKWFDNYEGQEIALFDDFRGSRADFGKLLQITDRYLCRTEVKGGSTYWYPRYIFFTSNQPISLAFAHLGEGERVEQFVRRVHQSGGGEFDFRDEEQIKLFKSRLDGWLVVADPVVVGAEETKD